MPFSQPRFPAATPTLLETTIEEANKPADTGFRGSFGGPAQKPAPNLFKGLKPEDLNMQGGKVIVKADPGKGLQLAQAVQANLFATHSGDRQEEQST